jgi:hypothetical protein
MQKAQNQEMILVPRFSFFPCYLFSLRRLWPVFSPVFGGVLREPADASVGRLLLCFAISLATPPAV